MGRGLEKVTLFDVAPAEGLAADPRLELVAGDITRPGVVFDLVRPGYDAVYHLAAVVSGAAEADIDLGYAVNLDGTRHLLDAIRAFARRPRLVFASSCAVFGGAMPDVLGDDTPLTPQTSYGAQKAMGELLVADFHRKGLLDGRSLRLPTICVRPGKPNKAASTWASSIIREPLAGQEAVCPVEPRRRHVPPVPAPGGRRPGPRHGAAERGAGHHPPRQPARHDLQRGRDGRRPGARRRQVGHRPHPLGARRHDPEDRRRLAAALRHAARASGWASRPTRSMDEIVQQHIEDELGGTFDR